MQIFRNAMLGIVVCLPAAAGWNASSSPMAPSISAQAGNLPPQPALPGGTETEGLPPKGRNLLESLGPGFHSPWWNQRKLLNPSVNP
jgi:hypothetical protein